MALKDKDARKEYNRQQYLKRKNALIQVTQQQQTPPQNQPPILPSNLEENIVLHIGDCYSVKSNNTTIENPIHNSSNDLKQELEDVKEQLYYAKQDIKDQEEVIKDIENDYKSKLQEKDTLIEDQEHDILALKEELKIMKLLMAEKDNQISFFKELLLTRPNVPNMEQQKKEPFCLQKYLANECSNAIPIEDFKNSFKVEYDDLVNLNQYTYEENMKRIVDRIYKTHEFTNIPIKCSNLKDKTIYVKKDEGWIKDVDTNDRNSSVRNIISRIDSMLMRYMPEFRKKNPGWNDSSSRENDIYDKIGLRLNDVNDATKTRLVNYIMEKSVIQKK